MIRGTPDRMEGGTEFLQKDSFPELWGNFMF